MRFLIVFALSLFLLCPSAYAINMGGECLNIMDKESSDWIKTQEWQEYVIKRWKTRPLLLLNRLLEGFENPVCHVFAAENNLIAGLEGLGKYPANPKKINYVKWQDFSDFDIDNNGKPLIDPDGFAKGLELARFDINNNGKPVIIEKDIRKGGGCDPDHEARTGICIRVKYLYNKYTFNLYDMTNIAFEDFIRLKERGKPAVREYKNTWKHKKKLDYYKVDLRYEPVRTISFFTYDGVSYTAEREKIRLSHIFLDKKYRTVSSDDDFIYRYDNSEKKQICHFGRFPSNRYKYLRLLNKLFVDMTPSIRATFIVEFSTHYSYADYKETLSGLGITKENYAEQTIINKALLDEIEARYRQIEKCTGKKLIETAPKTEKPEDIFIDADNPRAVFSTNGKIIGKFLDDDYVADPYGKIIGKKIDNKVLGLDGKVIGFVK